MPETVRETELLGETVEEKVGGGEDVSGEVWKGEEGTVERCGKGRRAQWSREMVRWAERRCLVRWRGEEVHAEVGRGEKSPNVNDSGYDPNCTECRRVYPNPTPEQLIMCLHALRYMISDVQVDDLIFLSQKPICRHACMCMHMTPHKCIYTFCHVFFHTGPRLGVLHCSAMLGTH